MACLAPSLLAEHSAPPHRSRRTIVRRSAPAIPPPLLWRGERAGVAGAAAFDTPRPAAVAVTDYQPSKPGALLSRQKPVAVDF
jgi:hypothetical protein